MAADLTASASVGDDVLLASYYEIHHDSCLALQAPRVRVTAAPDLGSATVVRIQQQPVRIGGRCGTMAVPVTQVRYRARQPGVDSLVWEVRYQAGNTGADQVAAEVRVAPPRPAARR
ncbi:MAG TPA: hypothetical protein VEA17_19730 [Bordetella sp.]|nr:hypothetical protein [Bordetella sp.]